MSGTYATWEPCQACSGNGYVGPNMPMYGSVCSGCHGSGGTLVERTVYLKNGYWWPGINSRIDFTVLAKERK